MKALTSASIGPRLEGDSDSYDRAVRAQEYLSKIYVFDWKTTVPFYKQPLSIIMIELGLQFWEVSELSTRISTSWKLNF